MSNRKPSLLTRLQKNDSGQMSIFMAILALLMLGMVAFVINIGMLVHAKINLQNAADMAAYTGASVQARQLNHIGFLNYEMRRNYKKFLFRYYVLGNMFQQNFPRSPTNSNENYIFVPGNKYVGNQIVNDNPPDPTQTPFDVPMVCFQAIPGQNYCKLRDLKAVQLLQGVGPIVSGINVSIGNINQSIKTACENVSQINQMLLTLWLFNTDPTLANVKQSLQSSGNASPQYIQSLQYMTSMATGMGLFPKLITLRQRIKNLEKIINQEPGEGINRSAISSLKQAQNKMQSERQILAFESAYKTLGASLFGDSVSMDELLPSDGTQGLLKLEDVVVRGLQTFSYAFVETNTGNSQTDCTAYARPMIFSEDLKLGVYKDPEVETFYAVRLRAKPRLLFNIFGDFEISAYAAAKPFGSRIGPKLPDQNGDRAINFSENYDKNQVRFPANTVANLQGRSGPCESIIGGSDLCNPPRFPNLPMGDEELFPTATQGTKFGFHKKKILSNYYRLLDRNAVIDPNSSSPALSIRLEDLELATRASMAPNINEIGQYMIPADTDKSHQTLVPESEEVAVDDEQDPMIQFFHPETQVYKFYAPLSLTGSSQEAVLELQAIMDDFFQTMQDNPNPNVGVASNLGNEGTNMEQLKNELIQGLTRYVESNLAQNLGENGEGILAASITNPMFLRAPHLSSEPLKVPLPETILPSSLSLRDSYAPPRLGNRSVGRVGYSVKYESFRNLKNVPTSPSNLKNELSH